MESHGISKFQDPGLENLNLSWKIMENWMCVSEVRLYCLFMANNVRTLIKCLGHACSKRKSRKDQEWNWNLKILLYRCTKRPYPT